MNRRYVKRTGEMPDVIVRHLFYPDNKNRKYTIFLFFLTFI